MCRWCLETFKSKQAETSHDCAVKAAVQRAEAQAGHPLNYGEVKAARDRARKELAMAREYGRG